MVHVFATMGTVVSLETPCHDLDVPLRAAIEHVFADDEDRFSLYRDESELSRIARGEVLLIDASEPLRATYATALEWRERTAGHFTPHRPDGVIDLSGIVKARATAAAGRLLSEVGVARWCLNVGGDVLIGGGAGADGATDDAWRIGITDPADRAALLTSLAIGGSRRAVATSGSSERGDHIWGSSPSKYRQVTVVADDIVTADVLATAIVAGGSDACDLLTREFDCDVLTVDADGALRATPGIRAAIARSASTPTK